MTTSYGYVPSYKPPKQGLARAASKDPYGLAPNNRSGPLGIGSSSGFATPTHPAAAHPAAVQPAPATIQRPGDLFPGRPTSPVAAAPPPTAADVNVYDINTDPALQQITALVGRSDTEAQAAALRQRQDLLRLFGDPSIASSVLGADDPTVQAAEVNPTSTVSQLHHQRDRNLKTLLDALNPENLAYSGYRVTQEQQAGEDFQNALAQAAGELNSNLGQVDSNLVAALSANRGQLAQGISSAGDRASQHASDTGVDPGAIDPQSLAAAAAASPGGTGDHASTIDYGDGLPVGATNNDAIYRLLGRKPDPRFQQ